MTESEVFESVTGSGSSDFALLVNILDQHGLWCLIGGLAVNCYVEPVYALDVDIVVVSSELESIKTDLARMPGSDLSIQLTLDSRYQDFVERTKRLEVLAQQVPVASLSDVVRGKVWAWSDEKRRATKRKKDELDLMRILEAFPETRGLMPEEIKKQVPE